jgi:protein gp37
MNTTTIEWTETTWNPTTGCDKVSPGCKHCYAEALVKRFGSKLYPNGFEFTIRRNRFMEPYRLKKPSRIFVNSMSDLFHEKMPVDVLEELFSVMNSLPQHQFQILTKRARRLASLAPVLRWSENIWMGVSIENQDHEGRADYLRQVPAKIRFISAEPLIGPLQLDLTGIHWVIVGGESQRGCRSFNPDWARSLLAQCRSQGVAYFLKQLGGYPSKRDRLEQFPTDLRIREYPVAPNDIRWL